MVEILVPGFVEPVPEFYQRLGHLAKQMAESYAYDLDKDTARKALTWLCFAGTCQQLEGMAHKQLRGIEWNEIDRDFIGAYCRYLPEKDEDDQPRAAAVARSGVSGTTLIAAAGLNRVLWVNYPWQGKQVLCKGAVMTFYPKQENG